jgi:tetratricopeptide (TPR) repeat protein
MRVGPRRAHENGRFSPHDAILQRRVDVFVPSSARGEVAATGIARIVATIATSRSEIMPQLETGYLPSRLRSVLFAIAAILTACCIEAGVSRAADVPAAMSAREAVLSPPLSKLEQRLFAVIHNGRFDRFSLLEAGLIAGGVDREEELRRYCRRFDALVESLRKSGTVHGTPRQQARAIFEFLHRRILSAGYSLQASDLRQAFDRGRFNCVTATLLMNCLAQRFDLQAIATQLPGHARSRLVLPDETLDIETTCPNWFDLADESKPQADGLPREINDVQLIATIYYNRGVDLLADRRFADAAAANAKAIRLDPNNATAKGNYLATINNWGIELATTGEYSRAAELFRLGMAADPAYEAFHANYVKLYRDWSSQLCREGQGEAAISLLHEAAQLHPDERYFHEAAVEIMRRMHDRSQP